MHQQENEILGAILFSVLSGHRRYTHITAIHGDNVLAEPLGIEQFRSEDSVRRPSKNKMKWQSPVGLLRRRKAPALMAALLSPRRMGRRVRERLLAGTR